MLRGEIRDVSSVSSEFLAARLFAAAASRDLTESDAVTIELRLPGGSPGWDRGASDAFFLCLDRALARVYPPLDPLQYAQTAPELTTTDRGERLARLSVVPTARHFSAGHAAPLAATHCVEGCAASAEAGEGRERGGGEAVDALWDAVRAARGEESGDGEAARAARRRRTAAWLTARFFNEASWHGRGAHSAVEAAAREAGQRVRHVDAVGMEVSGLIVGVTGRYAYIAVPERAAQEKHINSEVVCANSASRWALVARVPIPSALADTDLHGRSAIPAPRKRPRVNSCAAADMCAFRNAAEVMLHDAGPLRTLPPNAQLRVVLRAHKAYCTRSPAGAVEVVLEDVALVRTGDVAGLNSREDVLDIVRESGARFLRGYERHRESFAAAGTAPARLFASLTDTVSVRFRKARGRDAPPPLPLSSPRDIAALREGPRVEFKAAVAEWRDATGEPGASRATTDAERVRHTIAAMASTLGGALLVGVGDDGTLIGHTRDAAPALRLGGFCPAMVKGAVTTAEMRVVHSNNNNNSNSNGNNKSGEDAPATVLPREWWKGVGATQRAEERVVTIVSVAKGQAPFYTTSRRSAPYVRGFASTVPMPIVVCANRVAHLLP